MFDEVLSQVLKGMDLPTPLTTEEAIAFLSHYTTSVGVLEQVYIKLNNDGTVAEATTIKPANLRFNLGGLLMELLKGTVAIADTLESPVAALLFVIEFLKKTKELATLEVGLREANLLLALYRLATEQDALTIDHLKEVVDGSMSETQLIDALEKLERLSCITLTMEGIEVQETITIERKAEEANAV